MLFNKTSLSREILFRDTSRVISTYLPLLPYKLLPQLKRNKSARNKENKNIIPWKIFVVFTEKTKDEIDILNSAQISTYGLAEGSWIRLCPAVGHTHQTYIKFKA